MRAFTMQALLALCLAALPAAPGAMAMEGYLRTPDVHGETVVFTAEGDLWLVPVTGGTATRLTTHAGAELYPHFSPDGRQIAFSGGYDGNGDVFVVPAAGGEPRRMTWHPSVDQVVGWTPDGEHILFRSTREHPHGTWELFKVRAEGGDPEKLPLGWAARIDIEPDGGLWAFNRTERDFRTWKRYRGGRATTIWVGDPGKRDFREVTTFDGMNAFPMWHGGRIYFLSDQGGTVNIWSMLPDGGDRRRHTDLGDWDARFPSMGPDGRIVFMLAGDIHLFDPESGRERKIEIDLPSDRILTRVRYPDVGRYLTWLDLGPEGKRLAVTARGEVFSVPVEEGVSLPVTRGSGARERFASFGPQGKRLVYVTDESGEEEIRTIDSWGRGDGEIVRPAGKDGWHLPPVWSPDGKWIAYADNTKTLHVVPSEGGKPRVADRGEEWEISQYTWSPDGRWLAYSKLEANLYQSIFVYDVQEQTVHRISDPFTSDFSPAWDPEGKYLYYLSSRTTNPLLGTRDFQNINIRPTKPYLVLLQKDLEHPFANRAGLPPADERKEGEGDEESEGSEEEKTGEEKDRSGAKKGEKSDEEQDDRLKPVKIDFDGIGERVVEIPVDAGDYSALGAVKGKLFYLSSPLQGFADGQPSLFGDPPPVSSLMAFDFEKKKAETFLAGVSRYSLAAKGEKMAVMKRRGEIYVVGTAAPPPNDLSEASVSLEGVVLELNPREEWAQIFQEGWRLQREFYWDAGMAGVPWKKVRDQYASLLPRLSTRGDLLDLMGQMIGELSTSHTYVFGGDFAVSVPQVPTGLLGADLVREGDAFRVERIYRGAPADNEPSPLTQPGVGVKEGDYLLAVNGRPFAGDRPVHAAFESLAGKEVLLTVNDSPTGEGARDVVVTTLGGEGGLRYADWVRKNREYVEERTDGKIGYIHLPDMSFEGLIEFNTWYYPQIHKEGMVVDVRWNAGGFVSEMVVERFHREVIAFQRARNGQSQTYPLQVLNGPFVVMINEYSGSDGDMFPKAIQLAGLGPVIGRRSWGGVVGIRIDKSLVDGGLFTKPEFAWWDAEHGWNLENHGVDPDIEVNTLPQELAAGVDAQLDRAIAEVRRLHAAQPPVKPDYGPARPRSREAFRKELTANP